jgi:hypothetical protein
MKTFGEIETRLNQLNYELAKVEEQLMLNARNIPHNYQKAAKEREALLIRKDFIRTGIITLKWVLAEGGLTQDELSILIRGV